MQMDTAFNPEPRELDVFVEADREELVGRARDAEFQRLQSKLKDFEDRLISDLERLKEKCRTLRDEEIETSNPNESYQTVYDRETRVARNQARINIVDGAVVPNEEDGQCCLGIRVG